MKAVEGVAGWIGVDLDGTLAYHNYEPGSPSLQATVPPLGAPIPAMVARVLRWLDEGQEVRILTARVARGFDPTGANWMAINKWVKEHLGTYLSITAEKDPCMIELWDDRAVEVVRNVGQPARACACCVTYEQD